MAVLLTSVRRTLPAPLPTTSTISTECTVAPWCPMSRYRCRLRCSRRRRVLIMMSTYPPMSAEDSICWDVDRWIRSLQEAVNRRRQRWLMDAGCISRKLVAVMSLVSHYKRSLFLWSLLMNHCYVQDLQSIQDDKHTSSSSSVLCAT